MHEQDHPPRLHERHAGAGVSPLPPHRARRPAFPGQTYKKQEESVALLLGILPLVADQRGGFFFSAGLDRRPAAPEVGPGAKSPVVRTLRVVGAVSKPRGAAPRGPADSGGEPDFLWRKSGERTPGLRPGPGFLWPLVPTRWVWGLLALIRSRGYFLRYAKTDLGRIFGIKYAKKHFWERKSPNQGTQMGAEIVHRPEQCGTQRQNERVPTSGP